MSVSISGEGSVTGIDQGLNVVGVVTATSFVGSGANLTGIAATTNVRTNSLVVSGITTVSAGTAAAPSISPTGNSNTGIYFPSANTLAFSGGGSERLRIDNAGRIGMGTDNPTVALQLSPDAGISNVNVNNPLSSVAGAALTVAQFVHTNANGSYLRIKATRLSNGSSWTTASTKIVQVTDVTEQGYIEFNPSGANYGMGFGGYNDATGVIAEWARFLANGTFQFNSGYGSVATVYGVRAWVRKNSGFDGLGNGIMGSGNVTSLTQQATGRWTVNMTNAMPDTNFVVQATGIRNNSDAFITDDYSIRSTTTFTLVIQNYTSSRYDFGFSADVIR